MRYLGPDDPRRTGPMLAATTAEIVTGELVNLALAGDPRAGPFRRHLALGDPVGKPGSRGVPELSASQIDRVTAKVRKVGKTPRLRPQVWPDLSVASTQPDLAARQSRWASLFALPPPVRPTARPRWWTPRVAAAASLGTRTLAAAGPLYLDEVTAAITRASRNRPPPPDNIIAAALLLLAARIEPADGRWTHPGPPQPKDQALVAAARHFASRGLVFQPI